MEPRSSRPGHGPGLDDDGDAPSGVIVAVGDWRWRRLVPQAERIARRAAERAGAAGAAVRLADDGEVRRLNGRFRGRNTPTNVLTFEPVPGSGAGGDIVLALGVVRREARDEGKRPGHHLAHLVVHGALHLQGLDHGRAGDARRMENEETRILRRLGVPNPWKPGRRGRSR